MKDHILSVKEKIGYGMGDAASHIIFDNVMLYMMFFYTDIFGIPAGFVGTMFLLARALDAISDPCMGLLADRTRSRWGKFRPWILFGAIPFGLVCVLAYSSPDLSHNGKLIYAAVTYTLLTLLYTVVNIPYCALGGVITDNPTQRISLQSGASCWRRRGHALHRADDAAGQLYRRRRQSARLPGGHRGAVGDCLPDAGLLLLYHQRACRSAAEQYLDA
ncbi:hypothetical protein KPZU09_53790 [Klebsiella pneumoniae]|uniref:Xyloside transporter XynT n=1 Tax=Klebsiella pneumoniae TaxID=573 RepID=A0A919HYC3_KLEPN|nr:hypothetical protein KPZU09_53790 [Klebsiella pneumoniae]